MTQPTLTPELLSKLVDAVYLQQRDATGNEWTALQHTLNRLDRLRDGVRYGIVSGSDAAWTFGVARLYGLEVSDE